MTILATAIILTPQYRFKEYHFHTKIEDAIGKDQYLIVLLDTYLGVPRTTHHNGSDCRKKN